MRTPNRAMAALLAILAGVACATARAEVRLIEAPTDAEPAYLLSNGLVRATVAPAAGGSLRVCWDGPEGSPERTAVLASDSYYGQPCRYRVADQACSGSVAVLILQWTDGAGLEVTKTVSMLAGTQAARVDYVIANGSLANALLGTEFRFGATEAEWNVTVRHGGGLASGTASVLSGRTGAAFDYVSWFALADPEGRGVALVTGSGALRQLDVRTSGGAEDVIATGRMTLVPAGRSMRTRMTLAPFDGLGSPTGASETHLCAVSVERTEAVCRIGLRVLPLADAETGRGLLELADAATGAVYPIDTGRLSLGCGKVTPVTLHWDTPPPGIYEMRLALPGLSSPLVLGQCRVLADGARLEPLPGLPVGEVTMGMVRPRVPDGSGSGDGVRAGSRFYGAQAKPLESLRADVGVGESETLLVGTDLAGRGVSVEARLGRLTTQRRSRELPGAAWEFLHIFGGREAATTSMPGFVQAAGPGPVLTGSPLGLRLRCPAVQPATYRGRLEVSGIWQAASLPLEVTVWPVRRPRPGPVRLHLNALPLDPFGGCGLEEEVLAALRRCDVTNAALSAAAIAQTGAVRVVRDAGGPLPLGAWLGRRAASDRRPPLPMLDFSDANACLSRLLLSGLRDVTVCGRVSLDQLAPPGGPPGEQAVLAEWYWREFAAHLRRRGFEGQYFVSHEPYGAAALTDEWFATAEALWRAGWSVCGPYDGSVLVPALTERLARVTDLILLYPGAARDAPGAIEVLPPGVAVGCWVRGLPWNASADEARRSAHDYAAGGVGTVVVDRAVWPPPPPGIAAEGERSEQARALDSLAWEGFRDGMDEVNYVALLARQEGTGASGFRDPDGASRGGSIPAKGDVLAQLSVRQPPSLYWRDLALVRHGEPRAVIALVPDSPVQHMQAEMLNAIIAEHCALTLPLAGIEEVAGGPEGPTVLLFGSPDSNPLVAALAGHGAERLQGRLERDGYSCEEFSRGGVRYVGLLGRAARDWGTPVLSFAMGLRQVGGWVGP